MNESNRTGTPMKKVRRRPASSAGEWTGGGILTLLIIFGITYAKNHFDEKAKMKAQMAHMQRSNPPRPVGVATLPLSRPVAKLDFYTFSVPIEEGKAAGIEFAQANTRPPTVAALDAIVTAKMKAYDAKFVGKNPSFPSGSDYAPHVYKTSFQGTSASGALSRLQGNSGLPRNSTPTEPTEKAIPAGITPRSEYEKLFRQGFQQGYREATTPAF